MRGVPVKPLANASELLKRIENGEGAMLRSLSLDGPATARLRVSVQDKHRGFDWIDLEFEISGITDARLVDDNTLAMIDTDDGLSIVCENGKWGIGIGRFHGLEALKSSALYLVGGGLKYEEMPFSG